ncbi:acyltransferase family protein [Algibacter sp. L4_22]|uniref:acyltransferase family protein n=1 Tax=Algibacter sp. L4_22 TaxID=2942477 RepID=UPI00201B6385|nr:acyltransferase family protein [Algibacter sp. L4_22]MCL5129864.1 acyltransferase family protein [Algibacter sp. L4_22]
MKKRLEYIDQIRGLAIMLVVIGHIIQFNKIQGGMKSSIFNIIYSFHMPLFFFSQEWNSIKMNDIINTITYPNLWFLKTLFEIFLFYGFFVWISSLKNKSNNILKDILIFIFISVLTIIYSLISENKNFSSLFLYTLFFYMAVFISKYSMLEKLVMNKWVFASSFILFITLIGHWKIEGTIYDDILKLIISTFSFILFLNLTIKFKWNPFISKQIMTFGQYSLGIYVIQFHLAKLTINSHTQIFDDINPILLFFICLIISIPICYLSVWISKLIELNSLLNFIFLGKKLNVKKVKLN